MFRPLKDKTVQGLLLLLASLLTATALSVIAIVYAIRSDLNPSRIELPYQAGAFSTLAATMWALTSLLLFVSSRGYSREQRSMWWTYVVSSLVLAVVFYVLPLIIL